MLKLEIHGKDIQELYVNGVNLLLLLTRGGNAVFAQPTPQPPAEPPKPTVVEGEVVPTAEPLPNPSAAATPPKPRGRPPKTTTPAATPAAASPANDDPLGLSDAPKPAAATTKPLTLDDMRDRVKAIIAAHTETRKNSMQDAIAYVRRLFEPFGIKLAAELKPAQFAEFIAKSQAYLDGTAK